MKKSSTPSEESKQNQNVSNLPQENKNQSNIMRLSRGLEAFQPSHKNQKRSRSRKDQALIAFKHSEKQKHQRVPPVEENHPYMNGFFFNNLKLPYCEDTYNVSGSCRLVGKHFHAKFFFTEFEMNLPEYLTPDINLNFQLTNNNNIKVKIVYCPRRKIYLGRLYNRHGVSFGSFRLFDDDTGYKFTPRIDFNTLRIKVEDYCVDYDKELPLFQLLPSNGRISDSLDGPALLICYQPTTFKSIPVLGSSKVIGNRFKIDFDMHSYQYVLPIKPRDSPSGFRFEIISENERLIFVMKYLHAIRAFVGVAKNEDGLIRMVFWMFNS